MNKHYSIFITALFSSFIGLFLVANAVSPDKEFSPMENRVLAQRPSLSASDFEIRLPIKESGRVFTGKFMSEFETYVTDQFVGRDHWIGLKSGTERALGKKENNGVYFGEKNTLITRFKDPDPAKVTNNLNYVNKFVDNVEIPVYFSLIPTQAYIWADRLPAGAPNADQAPIMEQAKQTTHGSWIDIGAPLASHKDEDIFYRTDHHWTSLGAYYGYTAVCDSLGITPVPLSDYQKTTVSEDFYGTVFSSSGVRWVSPDVMDIYVPEDGITVTSHTYDNKGRPIEEDRELYVDSYLDKKDKYSMFLGGNQPLGVVKTQNTDAPKLLIIRDSYADSIVPFLTPHFSEIHLLDLRYYKMSAAQYIRDNNIDEAIVLYSVPNFTTDTNLVWLSR